MPTATIAEINNDSICELSHLHSLLGTLEFVKEIVPLVSCLVVTKVLQDGLLIITIQVYAFIIK